MTDLDSFSRLQSVLRPYGYKYHGEGTFTRNKKGEAHDWVMLQRYADGFRIDVGVVFPKVSRTVKKLMPRPGGAVPFGGIPATALPVFSAPLQRYISLAPVADQFPNSAGRSYSTPQLTDILSNLLPEALAPFRVLPTAVAEAESCLRDGHAAAMTMFMIPFIYMQLGQRDAAASFSENALRHIRTNNISVLYSAYLTALREKFRAAPSESSGH